MSKTANMGSFTGAKMNHSSGLLTLGLLGLFYLLFMGIPLMCSTLGLTSTSENLCEPPSARAK